MDSLWASVKVDWHERGSCYGTHNPIFFPIVETDALLDIVRKLFCDHCPVRTKCLNSALINNDSGFWGGTSTDIRQALKRNRHRTKCPVCKNDRLMLIDHDGTQPVPPHEVCLACGASWKGKPDQTSPAPAPVPVPVPESDVTEAAASCA